MRRVVGAVSAVVLSFGASTSGATEADAPDVPEEPPPVTWILDERDEPPPPTFVAPPEADPGPRLRFGSGLTGGVVIDAEGRVRPGGGEVSRVGVQLNDSWAFYGQPEVGFFAGAFDDVLSTELFGASALVDLTIADRWFTAVGGGFVDAGPQLVFRMGGYPYLVKNDEWPFREGLSVGTTVRVQFVESRVLVVPTFDVAIEFL